MARLQRPSRHAATIAQIVALAVLCFATARFGLLVHFAGGTATPIWPPTGISLAALLLFGRRLWPGVAIGTFAATLSMDVPLAVAIGGGAAATVEALLGTWLLERVGFRSAMDRLQDPFALTFLAAGLASAASASIGVLSQCTFGGLLWSQFGAAWTTWWLGDAVSAILIAPLLLTWATNPRVSGTPGRAAEAGAAFAIFTILALVAVGWWPIGLAPGTPLLFMVYPGMIWIALRFGQRGIALANLIFAVVAIAGAVERTAPFRFDALLDNLLYLDLVMVILATTGSVLAAALAQRRDAEQELRASRASLEAAQAQAHLGSWEFDLERETGVWSPEMYRLFDRDPRLGVPTPEQFFALTHPEDREAVAEVYAAAREGREFPASVDFRTNPTLGDVRYIAATLHRLPANGSQSDRLVGTMLDLTDRRRVEEELRTSRRRLREFLQRMPIMMDAFDENGTVLVWNAECERVTGYSADEIVGNPRSAELLYPDAAYRSAMYDEWARRGNDYVGWEWEITTKDGSKRTVAWSNISDRNPIPGWTTWGVGIDVTDRRQLEAQLVHAQKMEAIGRLAGGVAHDFNNLLTVMLGYGEMLEASLSTADPAHKLIRDINTTAKRAAALTRQMLAFSRRQIFTLADVSLNDIVVGTGQMLGRLIGEDVDVETDLDPKLSLVRADIGQIEQVLVNLVVNARDAMPHGGRLRIETLDVELEAPLATERELIPAGAYVRLVVADSGEGIPATVLPHIFEPFFTTKDVGKGTGLGLATVYGIIRQLGGYVAVSSAPGRGATFAIYLPATAPAPSTAASETSADEIPRGSETVLVVEDDAGVRRLATEMLRMHGYTVIDAPNGEEALKRADEHDGPIDLLLSDVVMPGMNGRELAERLIEMRAGLKVLFVSGYTDDQVLRHDILGADVSFLQKPFTIDSLIRKVSETIGSR